VASYSYWVLYRYLRRRDDDQIGLGVGRAGKYRCGSRMVGGRVRYVRCYGLDCRVVEGKRSLCYCRLGNEVLVVRL
jgi:hypothetical protein